MVNSSTSRSRWSVVAAYALLAAVTQLLWVTFTPITTAASREWEVSIDAVGWLSLVFPLVYVLLSIPFGLGADRWLRGSLLIGGALTAVGALIRIVPGYEFALIGQLVIAIGQPLVLNAVNKLAVLYVRPEQRANAIAAGTASLFVGILVSTVTVPFVMAWQGMPAVLWTQGGISVIAAVAMGLALRRAPVFEVEAAAADTSSALGLRAVAILWSQRWVRLFSLLLFAGFGIFITLATWLEVLASAIGYNAQQVGIGIGVMTAAGIAGAAVVPRWAMHGQRARTVVLCSLVASVLLLVGLAVGMPQWLFISLLAVCGFLLLADLPVMLSLAEAKSDPQFVGAVTGLLLLFGNLGGIMLSLAVQLLLNNRIVALSVLAAVVILILPAAMRLQRVASK
ncbi:MFS transporter [Paenibacillus qinlingensis]|uniref:MFS family arabinose efflux permease n=1 Tax=Paenibacillus qinlingensis TaxID=1837343 RepID=A0ABU1P4B7_9BACL|nr:MFS transporter [Paenibacillus qinlingensis]MDR6553912.1 putative MFS family arabinose efflux permease [Paenibacillus qinlingensis]